MTIEVESRQDRWGILGQWPGVGCGRTPLDRSGVGRL